MSTGLANQCARDRVVIPGAGPGIEHPTTDALLRDQWDVLALDRDAAALELPRDDLSAICCAARGDNDGIVSFVNDTAAGYGARGGMNAQDYVSLLQVVFGPQASRAPSGATGSGTVPQPIERQ